MDNNQNNIQNINQINQNQAPINEPQQPTNVSQMNTNKKKKIPMPVIILLFLLLGFLVYRNYGGGLNLSGSKTNWKKFEFSVDGVKKQLPLTTDELLKDLPTGWIIDGKHLKYTGPDKSIDSSIYFEINEETNKIFSIATDFEDAYKANKETRFEINGVNENTKEEDLIKVVGPTKAIANGKKLGKKLPGSKRWSYTYTIDGRNLKTGYFTIYGFNNETGEVGGIILFDVPAAPKEVQDEV